MRQKLVNMAKLAERSADHFIRDAVWRFKLGHFNDQQLPDAEHPALEPDTLPEPELAFVDDDSIRVQPRVTHQGKASFGRGVDGSFKNEFGHRNMITRDDAPRADL